MLDQLQTDQNLHFLYELSLAVGQSLDFKENCDHFLGALMTRKGLSFAAIWLREDFTTDEPSEKYLLAFATPKSRVLDEEIDETHFLSKEINKQEIWFQSSEQKDFSKAIQERSISKGTYILYRLQNIGFLKLYTSQVENTLVAQEYEQLKSIIDKFTLSIKANFEHSKLIEISRPSSRIDESSKSSKANYHTVGQSLTDGLLITNLEDKIIYANDKIAEIAGYEKEELVGKIAYELFLAKKDQHGIDLTLASRQEGISEKYESRFLKKDGSFWYAVVNVSPYRNATGTITGSISGITDITEKKLAKIKLEESNRKYRDLFENMYDAFIILDKDGYIKDANKAAKQLYGFTEEERISSKYGSFIHPDDQSKATVYFQKLQTEGFYTDYEGRIITNNQEVRYVQVNSNAIIKNGKYDGSRDFIRDVTAKKASEKRVRESEDKLSLIINQALDGVLIIDNQNVVTEWNPQCEKLFGYKREEVIGKVVPEIISFQKYKELQIQVVQYLKSKDQRIFETQIELEGIRKDGSKFLAEVSVTPIQKDNSYFFSTFVRDISLRKLEEERREKLLDELEYKNQELKEFAYIVSHDLKAPLRAIKSLANWIAEDYEDVLDEDGLEQIGLLQARVDRMQSFIEGILEYSRVGRLTGTEEVIDLNISMKEMIVYLDPPKHFTVNIVGPFPTIKAEKIRIEQVIQNLVSNAIKYNDKEHGIITISCEENEDFYIFNVADNGKGINPRHFQKIFQIFQTLQARDQYESTGIGLTIVKKIIETLGGKIEVVSEVKVGSTFSVYLPKKLNASN